MMTTSPSACIQIKEGTHVAKCVLMPGDPLRAKFIAETYLENPVLFNDVRNMFGYTGTYEGKEVSVMGSGMGVPSMVLYAHELFNFFDVESIIRVGSGGGLQDDVHVRDVVIAMTASTNSAHIGSYPLVGTPAPTADFEMLRAAVHAAEEMGVTADVGSVYTSDFFYHPDKTVNQKAKDMGLMAVEMETAGLYLEAMASKKRALSILTISDHIFNGEFLTPQEIRESFHEMMEIALKTAVRAAL
ncbi:MAG: purine-nucleoside phosphorylase [Eubacterium sp.]|nr:purine-nucleoside phosphorylase [Eubacterium sp.]MBQ9022389.1 purine-nucleoside phosphorylase [Eubacterium sp.]